MGIRPNGFSTPFGGISWEYSVPAKNVIQHMFWVLESKRILYNPIEMEVVSQCVESALNIRDLFVETRSESNFSADDQIVFDSLIGACNTLLDELNKTVGVPHQSFAFGNNFYIFALQSFRAKIREGIIYFENTYSSTYKNEIPLDIEPFYMKDNN